MAMKDNDGAGEKERKLYSKSKLPASDYVINPLSLIHI